MIEDLKVAFQGIIERAKSISADIGTEIEEILRAGRESTLSPAEARSLLSTVIERLKCVSAAQDGMSDPALNAAVGDIVSEILSIQKEIGSESARAQATRVVALESRNGIDPTPVRPRPCFHGKEVAMNSGFVRTSDIDLWDRNERLDIHLNQFEQTHGRKPTPDERLELMMSKMQLPGIEPGDQFEIIELARSIAINGVRKPPIIDIDGTLLDGNRRVTACRHILASDEFDAESKKRVEYVFVWQLTEHATADERNAVVISLNFEPDCKQDWPAYVKARKIFEEWQALLALEPTRPGNQRQAALKRDLSRKYALGPDTAVVNRYIKMVEWCDEFEQYHIGDCGRDQHEVNHRASKYFQYFDELGKGRQPGGVAYALEQDEAFRHTVFDLLFDGKFDSWRQIRQLKFVYDNDEAREQLVKARNAPNVDEAKEVLEDALSIARQRRAEERSLGANTRIESFVKWLEELPVKAFRDNIRMENLRRLLSALRLVEKHSEGILSEETSGVQ